MRNVHRETLKKLIISENNDEKYSITWQFFDAMSFLNHHINIDHNIQSTFQNETNLDLTNDFKVLKLIEEVKARPILWNTKMVSSPITPLKTPMWQEVAKALGTDGIIIFIMRVLDLLSSENTV